jgi:hypothetical protein
MDLSKMPIGGGNKTNVRIGAKSKTTVIFPFTIHFDAFSSTTAPIIGDLLQKCGINNQAKQDIVINYDVTPIIHLVGFPITFTISSHSAFACPEVSSKRRGGRFCQKALLTTRLWNDVCEDRVRRMESTMCLPL